MTGFNTAVLRRPEQPELPRRQRGVRSPPELLGADRRNNDFPRATPDGPTAPKPSQADYYTFRTARAGRVPLPMTTT